MSRLYHCLFQQDVKNNQDIELRIDNDEYFLFKNQKVSQWELLWILVSSLAISFETLSSIRSEV